MTKINWVIFIKTIGTIPSILKDPKIGGSSQTGFLDSAWDDITIQVAKGVSKNLR